MSRLNARWVEPDTIIGNLNDELCRSFVCAQFYSDTRRASVIDAIPDSFSENSQNLVTGGPREQWRRVWHGGHSNTYAFAFRELCGDLADGLRKIDIM